MSKREIVLKLVEAFLRQQSKYPSDALKNKEDFEKLAHWIYLQ